MYKTKAVTAATCAALLATIIGLGACQVESGPSDMDTAETMPPHLEEEYSNIEQDHPHGEDTHTHE